MSADVVVWGASGFTGRLVCEYLARSYGAGKSLTWAIAGRSRQKLEEVRRGLEAIDPAARELQILVGDSGDRPWLDALALAAKVVVSTVGPYGVHGRGLVAACVDAGTSYCDITGEPTFIRAMIDAHHARAHQTGARIVHACGFDSIPADLGTLMVQTYAREKHGQRCSVTKYFTVEARGAFSGGTFASIAQIFDELADRDLASKIEDPYALDPGYDGPLRGSPLVADQRGVVWDEDIRRWTAPYPLALTDARVVRRTNALLGYAWGKDFVFREGVGLLPGPAGLLAASGLAAGVNVGMAAMRVTPIRRALAARVFPAPGEGPSADARAKGYFSSRAIGELEGGGKVFGLVRGASDPGYGETSKMLAESAVCLAKDDAIRKDGGVLTAGACMGMRLVERLRATGMSWEVGETLAAVEG
jgi:short subunit dehydrogenase-like uncharacterized protein